ncbi:MAG: class I SAM-dependent methyltransferase [Armatimonadota bacterium]
MCALALTEREILMPDLPREDDLFGRVLMDAFTGQWDDYYVRRDDNFTTRDNSRRYFRSWDELPEHHRCLLDHARGQVLDLGAGAGQHALPLQENGLAVTAIDASPLAVEVCRRRGVKDARLMDAQYLDLSVRSIDTVLMMGNNLGIAGTLDGLRALLRRLHRIVRPGGQILAEVHDYTAEHAAIHLRYHQWNLARDRYPGSVRIRVEYQGARGPEFDWLLIKLTDLKTICAETGWKITRCVQVNVETTYAMGLQRVEHVPV